MEVLEEWMQSKSGVSEDSEDAYIVTPHYACVVDGATSCTGRKWTTHNLTGGQWASRVLTNAIHTMLPNQTPAEIVTQLTQTLADAYKQEGVLEFMKQHAEERATASLVLYVKASQEILMLGDCQAAFILNDGEIDKYQPTKYIDTVTSQARALYLESELLVSARNSISSLQKNDTGRDYIRTLLARQRLFQNNADAPLLYRYWVLDGFPINLNEGMLVHSVPSNAKEVILATDGYPDIFKTLQETEAHWNTIINQDPLMTRQYPSTKGVQPGAESFDDRTYLRIAL
uniref:PPM-type phosphatase domain-containing protein n=1 Tax=Attheya septentrionalis TaxID=420275 RepID=A0A7S2UT86_9STRA|mmetsp:Transcript_8905/g.16205  ORF Transcript_8905/g.16205 Transcript_8905/m.16205 type:complete len:287 (+) Transcript_8905:28-888(+)